MPGSSSISRLSFSRDAVLGLQPYQQAQPFLPGSARRISLPSHICPGTAASPMACSPSVLG